MCVQPREVLDSLEQEMEYLDNHLSNTSTDTDSLPEMIGDLFHAEEVMKNAIDALE
jgi:hypothetical protein